MGRESGRAEDHAADGRAGSGRVGQAGRQVYGVPAGWRVAQEIQGARVGKASCGWAGWRADGQIRLHPVPLSCQAATKAHDNIPAEHGLDFEIQFTDCPRQTIHAPTERMQSSGRIKHMRQVRQQADIP